MPALTAKFCFEAFPATRAPRKFCLRLTNFFLYLFLIDLFILTAHYSSSSTPASSVSASASVITGKWFCIFIFLHEHQTAAFSGFRLFLNRNTLAFSLLVLLRSRVAINRQIDLAKNFRTF